MSGDKYWLMRIEALITKHSTSPRKRGKYKGHGSTDTRLWVADLEREMTAHIRKRNKGKAYDENMAVASLMGRAMVIWYCNVRRAKSLDPNRPLARGKVNRLVTKYRGEVCAAMADDYLMTSVWKGQQYNFPWGKGRKGGTFV